MTLSEAAIDNKIPDGIAFPMPDGPELRQAIAETAPHLLLPVLVHLTGDETFLDRFAPCIASMTGGPARFTPDIDPTTTAEPTVTPAELEAELRDRLLQVLTDPDFAEPPRLSESLFTGIAGAIVGELVDSEFVPLLIDQMGFAPAGKFVPQPHRRPPAGYKIAIIGAGLSGLVMGIKLAEAGYDFRIFEKNADVGGVWFNNVYPGVAVDTPSHFYSFSFELNPDWPRYFSSGPVLMDYWRKIADKYQLRQYISFQTKVRSAIYDESAKNWKVTSCASDGEDITETYDVVISAAGLFSHPVVPNITGLNDFEGPAIHSAEWNHEVDLKGKRVALIGTGASAVQVGPKIASDVAQLTVFQRTPPWLFVRPGQDYNGVVPDSLKWGLRHIPHLAQWMRFYTYWFASDGLYKFVKTDPDWPENNMSVSAANEQFGQLLLTNFREKLSSRPDLLEKMTPNYPIMGKRLLQDSYWCDMMMRDNVSLVTESIDTITADGVRTKDGVHHPADVLILATGFAMTKMMQQMAIVGRGGVTMRDRWGEDNPRSYMGTMVPGFPNLFLMVGPNGAGTHGAALPIFSEAQTNYILTCLDTLFETDQKTIEPREDVHDDYNRQIDEALEKMVWNHKNVTTYYRNSQGRNFLSCPWRIVDFWNMMRAPKLEDMVLG